ncbi:MAG: hypothetical protein H0X30_38800 [Anaerolineae bacterium]|nr:hypothetical protein [Anaerolineae bacterium]
MKSPLKQPTTATCFSSFMLPHVLFVRSFEERQKAAMSCCLGWNISLFPNALQRKQQIDRVWDRVEADNQEPAPPGLEQGFKQDLRMLTTQKQDLFPWLNTNIPRAELSQSDTHDILSIKTGHSGIEEIRLVTHPDPLGLPLIIEVLRGIQRDTAKQVELVERVMRGHGVFGDIETTQMTTAYCVQRADLIGYHRMLTVWRDTQPAPSLKRVIGHWLQILHEIEGNTKAVLGLLVSCR